MAPASGAATTAITSSITFWAIRAHAARLLIESSGEGQIAQTVGSMTNAPDTDRYLPIPELIERWPIGRTKTYELVRAPGFPEALVLVRDQNGRPRSMGFLLSEVIAFEQDFRVPAGELALPDEDETLECSLPPAKRAMPKRSVR